MGYDDELAAYDAGSARTFGREVAEAAKSVPWRSGPPGILTAEEDLLESALTFGRYNGQREVEARHQVEETRRQLAKEREVLERARRLGWETALLATPGADRALAESVRARAGDATTTSAGQPAQQVQESTKRTRTRGGRAEVREVVGWTPKPPRGAR